MAVLIAVYWRLAKITLPAARVKCTFYEDIMSHGLLTD